jgi:hypothetical protein
MAMEDALAGAGRSYIGDGRRGNHQQRNQYRQRGKDGDPRALP